eukprot:c24384_g1_i1 orf=179-3538(+)
MVPQGQLAYYTPTPAPPALPLYQTAPYQFPQHPHVPYMQSASPASASETPMYGHPSHPAPYVGTPTSVPPSCVYPNSTHHANFAHRSGSEHASTSFSNGGTLPCSWQGQAFPPSSSPPPPAYPPGFEPKQNNVSMSCASGNVALGNPCMPNSHPLPHLNGLPHQHQHPVSSFQPAHPHPHPQLHHHPSPQTACHAPMPHPAIQSAHPSMFHGHDGGGTVIGVPVMGTPVYADAVCAPPPAIPQGVEPAQVWQPKYGRRLGSSEIRQQSCKSTFHLTKYFRRNGSHSGSSPKGARKFHQNTWQPSNSQTSDSLFNRDYLSPNRGRTFIARETNNEHRLPPCMEETRQLCSDTSNVRNLGHKQLASTFDNVSLDPGSICSGMDSPLRRDRSCRANGRQPPNTCRDDQPQSNQDLNLKAGPVKENCMHNTQNIPVDGQQNLDLCRFREHKGNLHREGIEGRSDGQPLRFNPCERSSLALACSEAQFSSHVQCEQKGCSPATADEEHKMGSASTGLVDSKTSALPSKKNKEGLSRWLEERKHNYPTPKNILRKAEEKKRREEMGEFDSDKTLSFRQHMRNGFTTRYDRRERPRVDKNTELLGQCIGESQLANTDSRDKEENCGTNDLYDSYRSANDTEMSQNIDGVGPMNSPTLQGLHSANDTEMLQKFEDLRPVSSPIPEGEVSDLQKGIRGRDSQSVLTSDDMAKPNNIERILDPGNMFLFRRKRRKQPREQITLVVQRQKKLLLKLLNRDIDKERSYLLQCCRFIVNNHYLQGHPLLNVKHFKWVGAAKSSSGDDLPAYRMHKSESSLSTNEEEMGDLGVEDFMTRRLAADAQDLNGRECAFKGEDKCQEVRKSALANVENAFGVNVLLEDSQHASASTLEELSCSNREQELIEDAQHADALPVQELIEDTQHASALPLQELIEEAQHASALPLQELNSSNNEPDLIAEETYRETGVQPCHQNDVGEVPLEFGSTSHNQSVVDRCVNGAESSDPLESCSRYEKDATFPWKYLDCYLDQKTSTSGFSARHYDYTREPFCVNGLITDGRHAPMLLSSSNLDAQGPAPFLWEQSNTDVQLPNHDMDTGELGSGICDNILEDDDDISKYMNFDAFETDSGMCYG